MYSLFVSQILFWTQLRDLEVSPIQLPLLLDWFLVRTAGRCRCSWGSLAIPCLVIASSLLHTSPFFLLFIPDFFWNKLVLLLLTSWLSSSKLYSFVQTTLLPLTLTSVILFLLLERTGDEVYVEEFHLPLGWVRMEFFVMCHSLAEARGDTVQDDVD